MYNLSKQAILTLVDEDADREDMEEPKLGIFLQPSFEQVL